MTIYLKTLSEGRRACYGGYTYPEPGTWTEPQPVKLCKSGYHLVHPRGLLNWLGEEIWLAEGRGKSAASEDGKVAFEQVRLIRQLPWNKRVGRLFGCDCTERALLRERDAGREPDERTWAATKIARDPTRCGATQEEISAAYAAVRSVTCSAARAAATAAVCCVDYSAAAIGAGDAASHAAYSVAHNTTYDAAYSAGYDAAYDVAAYDAAFDAAYEADSYAEAHGATYDAAYDTERVWQTRHLLEHYIGVMLIGVPK